MLLRVEPMLERISATSWFPPQEPVDCVVCGAACETLSPEGLASAGALAVRLIACGRVVPLLEAAVASLARVVGPGRVAVLVPEVAGKWRVFTSTSGTETHDLVIDSERYPELSEVRRTGTPFLAPDVQSAPELKPARLFLAAAGVQGLAAFPIFRATASVEPVVLKLSFQHELEPSQLALVVLIAHQLVHKLARLPQGDVASQLGIPLPPTEASDPRSLLRLLPLPAAVIDAEGRIVHANPRATWLLLGRDAAPGDEQVLGLRPERPWLARGSRWEAKLTTGTAELPVLGWSSQVGTERFLVLLEPHPEARRREHERRIRRTLAEKLRELEAANIRLAENARVRGRFVSDAAHELKTPLAILRSYLETLRDDLSEGLTGQQHEFLEAAAHGARRLQRLIDELLDLAALESGHLPLSLGMVASWDVVQAVMEELQPLAAHASVALRATGEPDLTVRSDHERLRQVLRNIIENGLKYTRPGGQVTVSMQKNGDRAILCVSDSGVGIPAEALPHIFDEFVRVPGNQLGEGAGLGLAIVRRLVLAMGGRVWAESSPDAGSRFFVELPLWTGEG
jgi:signal transduction histidine kinase